MFHTEMTEEGGFDVHGGDENMKPPSSRPAHLPGAQAPEV